jgi:hypothetical protein
MRRFVASREVGVSFTRSSRYFLMLSLLVLKVFVTSACLQERGVRLQGQHSLESTQTRRIDFFAQQVSDGLGEQFSISRLVAHGLQQHGTSA